MRRFALATALLIAAAPAWAQVKVGVITALSGPGASIGVPYSKGYLAWQAGGTSAGGKSISMIQIDDASDPSAAARAAKKLIEEDKVDIIVGSAGAPTSLAIYGVAAEAKVPLVITANALVPGEKGAWQITVPQPVPLMISADLEQMKKDGVKTIGYIGFSDAWGDLVYDGLVKAVEPAGMKVIANERYARADTSVTPQILKIMAQRPDAVFTGGSGSPGALPHLALAERGYRGHIYSTHAIINAEFVRIGGAAVEGLMAPTGPIVVADQLPAGNPIRAVAMRFLELYEKANGAKANDAFAAYGYDAMLLVADAVARAQGTPGTAAYREALRDALVTTKELVGTHAVYNYKPGERYGTDERSRVVVRLVKGNWQLVP